MLEDEETQFMNQKNLKYLEKTQRTLIEYLSIFLKNQCAKFQSTWIHYFKNLTLPLTYTKTENLIKLKKEQDLSSSSSSSVSAGAEDIKYAKDGLGLIESKEAKQKELERRERKEKEKVDQVIEEKQK